MQRRIFHDHMFIIIIVRCKISTLQDIITISTKFATILMRKKNYRVTAATLTFSLFKSTIDRKQQRQFKYSINSGILQH